MPNFTRGKIDDRIRRPPRRTSGRAGGRADARTDGQDEIRLEVSKPAPGAREHVCVCE